jgi:hypothetical protein
LFATKNRFFAPNNQLNLPTIMKSIHLIRTASPYYLLSFLMGIFQFSCQKGDENLQTSSVEMTLRAASLQDDFPVFFTNIAKQQLNEWESVLHPDYGIFIVYKPSTYAITQHFSDLKEANEELPSLSDYFAQIPASLQLRKTIPTFNCESFESEGCFYEDLKQPLVAQKVGETAHLLGRQTPTIELALAQSIDQKMGKIVVLTDNYLSLGFAKIDGQWYLVFIDTARYDCAS